MSFSTPVLGVPLSSFLFEDISTIEVLQLLLLSLTMTNYPGQMN